jgi:hypothetical protein
VEGRVGRRSASRIPPSASGWENSFTFFSCETENSFTVYIHRTLNVNSPTLVNARGKIIWIYLWALRFQILNGHLGQEHVPAKTLILVMQSHRSVTVKITIPWILLTSFL